LFKKILSLLVILLVISINTSFSEAAPTSEVKVIVNGKQVNFPESKPLLENGIVYTNISSTCRALHCTVWSDSKNTIMIKKGTTTISFPVGSTRAVVNYEESAMDAPAKINGGTILIPLKTISEFLGATANWNDTTKTMEITYSPASTMQGIDIFNSITERHTTYQLEWALAVSGILKKINNNAFDIMGGIPFPNERFLSETESSLQEMWGIYNRQNTLDTIANLKEQGQRAEFNHYAGIISKLTETEFEELLSINAEDQELVRKLRFVKEHYQTLGEKSLLGWDYCRLMEVAEKSFKLGYITAEEAWAEIIPAAQVVQKTFNSWEDLGNNYMLGRLFWCGETDPKRVEAMRWLLSDPQSPWMDLEWDAYLGKSTTNYAMEKKILVLNSGEAGVHINGLLHYLDSAPVPVGNEILVPVELMELAFNCEVEWQKDGKTILVSYGNQEIKFCVDKNYAYVNDKQSTVTAPAKIINDRFHIPFKFTADNMGITIYKYPGSNKIMAVMTVYNGHDVSFILPPGFTILGIDFDFISFVTPTNAFFHIDGVTKGSFNKDLFGEFVSRSANSFKNSPVHNVQSASTTKYGDSAVTIFNETKHTGVVTSKLLEQEGIFFIRGYYNKGAFANMAQKEYYLVANSLTLKKE